MNIIRYIDLYEEEEILQSNFTLPMVIDPYKVDGITPYFNSKGVLFKNVSWIKYENDMMKVVGNYKKLEEIKENRVINITGFRNAK